MFGHKTALHGARDTIRRKREDARGVQLSTGFLAGTLVATSSGWRPVEALGPGDRVLTFDNGMQVVQRVDHARVWTGEGQCPRDFWAVEVPTGAFGNRETLRLLPGQGVMIESDEAEMLYGDPFAIVPARALECAPGAARAPVTQDTLSVSVRFEGEEVVFSKAGAMYLCAAACNILDLSETAQRYDVLPMTLARDLVEGLTPAAMVSDVAATAQEFCPAA